MQNTPSVFAGHWRGWEETEWSQILFFAQTGARLSAVFVACLILALLNPTPQSSLTFLNKTEEANTI